MEREGLEDSTKKHGRIISIFLEFVCMHAANKNLILGRYIYILDSRRLSTIDS